MSYRAIVKYKCFIDVVGVEMDFEEWATVHEDDMGEYINANESNDYEDSVKVVRKFEIVRVGIK